MTDTTAAAAPEAWLLRVRALALACLLGLIVNGLAWELWIAPTGARTWALKVLPLAAATFGVLKLRMATHRWLSLLIWLYVAESLVRATTEKGLVVALALTQLALSLALFVACVAHVRGRLKRAAT